MNSYFTNTYMYMYSRQSKQSHKHTAVSSTEAETRMRLSVEHNSLYKLCPSHVMTSDLDSH
jgi:hypothetical protein